MEAGLKAHLKTMDKYVIITVVLRSIVFSKACTLVFNPLTLAVSQMRSFLRARGFGDQQHRPFCFGHALAQYLCFGADVFAMA